MIGGNDRARRHMVLGCDAAHRPAGLYDDMPGCARDRRRRHFGGARDQQALADFDLVRRRQMIGGDDRALRHAVRGGHAAHRLAGPHDNMLGVARSDRCARLDRCARRDRNACLGNARHRAVRGCRRRHLRSAGGNKPGNRNRDHAKQHPVLHGCSFPPFHLLADPPRWARRPYPRLIEQFPEAQA